MPPQSPISLVDSPISLAIISESPLPLVAKLSGSEDTDSNGTSVRRASSTDCFEEPEESHHLYYGRTRTGSARRIQVAPADPANVFKVAVELRNQYLLRCQSSVPAARVEVVLKQPRGLPFLKPLWKTPFWGLAVAEQQRQQK